MNSLEQKINAVFEQGPQTPIGDIVELLELRGDDMLALYKIADKTRRDYVGNEIYVRGMITISTHCGEHCTFCSLRAENRTHERFRMSAGEIANIVHQALHFGCTSIILQSGCDSELTCGHLCEIIDRISIFPNIGIALACGPRNINEFKYFRQYGADRYFLRFESSDEAVFKSNLPGDTWEPRMESLASARSHDMQIASGFLIGWPHTTVGHIAQDILFASQWKLDEIWCDPFISQMDTPLACKPLLDDRQLYFKAIALLRLLNPSAHILSSPAFNAVLKYGSDRCLLNGANTYIVNMTPERYNCPGEVYSVFTSEQDKTAHDVSNILKRVLKLDRKVGGNSGPSFQPAWVDAHPDDYQ